MSKIRKLYYFDKKKSLDMISFLNNSANDNYINKVMFNPLIPLHHILPIRLKFLPESYILKDNHEIKGLITVAPTKSRQKKMEIKKLFFEENSYEVAAELVQYVVSKYKAMGSSSILVKVDDYLPELLTMLITKCGFSQLSYEKLWRITKFPVEEYNLKEFRNFRNTDAQAVTNIYNETLLPHLRTLLGKSSKEFEESIFKGLSYDSKFSYIIKDLKTKNIIGYISINTTDNENFVVDITKSSWVNFNINSLIKFAADKISQRKKKFGFFVRTKRYTSFGEEFENHLLQNGYECVQNQLVLTNSSARILKADKKSGKYTVISDFCPSSAVQTKNINSV